jgi:hypothetical protein
VLDALELLGVKNWVQPCNALLGLGDDVSNVHFSLVDVWLDILGPNLS